VHGVVVDVGAAGIAVRRSYILRRDPGPIGQHSARDDTIVSGDVIVSGSELEAIILRADHLVVVDAVKRRGLLFTVVGAALGLDSAAGIISLCRGVGIGTLHVGVVDFDWLVGGSTRLLDDDVIGDQAVR
jgi:hypothetical protein